MLLRLMSANLRFARAPDGEQRWARRKKLALARIQTFKPHLLGLQECELGAQSEFLRRGLPDYGWVGEPRGGDGPARKEMAPLLYHQQVFELLDAGVFWLSETPQVPGSLSWGSSLARTAAWARLRLRVPPHRELLFANTHLDHASAGARLAGARLLRRFLHDQNRDLPLVLTGDFNAEKDSPPYRALTRSPHPRLVDAWRRLHPPGADKGTFHAYGTLSQASAIDWILLSEHFKVVQAGIDRSQQAGLFPSDHYPLWAEVRINE